MNSIQISHLHFVYDIFCIVRLIPLLYGIIFQIQFKVITYAYLVT